MSEKVFLCSLDGATWRILDPLLEAGELPVLESVIDDGTRGDLASTMPPSSPTAWTSFLTGVDPDTHGILDFTHLDSDNSVSQQSAFSTKFPTLWELLGEHGYRIHSLNVPMTYPAASIDGSMISGLPAPSVSAASTAPSDLAEHVTRKYDIYEVAPDHFQERQDDSLEAYVEYVTQSITNKFHFAESRLEDGKWDVAMLHIHETDIIQHCLWQYIDENHPAYDADSAERLKAIYRSIDSHLGSILELLPQDTTIIILSDHGFRRNETEMFINKWLQKKGYLDLPKVSSAQAIAYRFVKNHVSSRLATAIKDALTGSEDEDTDTSLPDVYAAAFENVETVAFSYGRRSAKLYVSEPEILEGLVAELETIEVDGERVVETVHRVPTKKGPDLIVEPYPPFSFESSLTSESLIKTVDPETDTHNGTHAPLGIFAAKGPGIARNGVVKGAGIIDLVPTVLYALDEEIPTHLDGELLQDVFETTTLETRQPRYTDMELKGRKTVDTDDTEDVRERLEDLGYL
ncbi:alkaline phosphatase family protein [Halobacteriales archaeon Cl-PHB]